MRIIGSKNSEDLGAVDRDLETFEVEHIIPTSQVMPDGHHLLSQDRCQPKIDLMEVVKEHPLLARYCASHH